MDLTGGMGAAVSEGIGLIRDTVNKIWPDKSEQERMEIANAFALMQGQMDINKIDAASPSVFVAGPRPFILWICGFAVAWQFLIRPAIILGLAVAGKPVPVLPGMDAALWELMFGMLGLGAMRSWEKVKGAAQ